MTAIQIHRPAAGPRICFVGLDNLPVLSRDHAHHGSGGEQVQHTLLARALVRRGFDVAMVVADYGQPLRWEMDGITLHRAHGLREGLPVLRFVHPRITRLWAALARCDAQTYYVSCAGPQLAVVAAFAQRHGRRVVFRIAHDRDCDPSQLLVRFWRDRQLYAWGLRRADVVLAQSAQQVRALRQHYGVDARLAGMLVEPAVQVLPGPQRARDVLWVNNLRPFKRPDLALELARRLPELSFDMVGGPQVGHEALFESTRGAAHRLPNLHFHGAVPYGEVHRCYGDARVFVNTSDSEGFPNAYLQAWRHATPTVAFFDPDQVIASHGLGAVAGSMDEMVEQVRRLALSGSSSSAGSGSAPHPGHNGTARTASGGLNGSSSLHGRSTDFAPDAGTLWQAASQRCLRFMDDRYGEDEVLGPYIEALTGPVAARTPSPAAGRPDMEAAA